MKRGVLHAALAAIAAATVATGFLQIVAPGWMLALLRAEVTSTSRHFFAIVGMFMCLFGGALLHALFSRTVDRLVVLWASLQKLGAAIAVALGVASGVFSSLALLVAGFDLFSGTLGMLYLWQLGRGQGIGARPAGA
ncbi:MAG: patatin [Gemmatimonadota bacterium]|nr:patatin [Gemmatimonadota bacterium]